MNKVKIFTLEFQSKTGFDLSSDFTKNEFHWF